jgi:16S rRNA G966 N2-methylase RsmD
MIRPIIDVLVVDEQRLLERWQSNPQVRDEHFLVSMARLPRGLQQEVLNMVDQQERWQECYGSDFQVNACVVDTSLLPIELSERVAAAVLGDETGVLIHGDAVRGMRYLQTRSDISLRCAYADPPYNTGGDDFPYVDGMPHSHWLCFMEQILKALAEVCETGVVMLSIGDREAPRLQLLLQECFGEENGFGPVIVQVNKGGRDYLPIALTHEYLLGSGLGGAPKVIELPRVGQGFRYSDAKGGWDERELRNRNPRFHKNNRPNLYYPFYVNLDSDDENGHCDVSLEAQDGWLAVWPLNAKGESSVWRWGRSKSGEAVLEGQVSTAGIVARKTRNGKYNIYEKLRKTTTKAKSIWEDSSVRTEQGSIELRGLFGAALFPHPKPRALVERCLQLGSEPGQWVLDFFGGSGTTADAALSLARQGLGVRPVVLIERGEHFERVLKRRVVKAAYSGNWASGRPVDAAPVSVCYRVVTLRDW